VGLGPHATVKGNAHSTFSSTAKGCFVATLIAEATAGKALIDDDWAKKAVAELSRD